MSEALDNLKLAKEKLDEAVELLDMACAVFEGDDENFEKTAADMATTREDARAVSDSVLEVINHLEG